MEETGIWMAMVVVVFPLMGLLFWWGNDIWYGLSVALRCSSSGKLPPGYMGIPFFGEMFAFLWYFKVVRRPDAYIHAKRAKYGDGVGLYRTHLFGSPSIIACTSSVNNFVLKSDSDFLLEWPSVEVIGPNSLVAVQGHAHTRVRGFVVKAINQPDALRKIALMVQPRIVAALESWAQLGTVVVSKEAKKVTFQNIAKYFASFEPGPILDTLDEQFKGLVKGIRAYPINFPGTAYHLAVQSRRKAMEIFKEEMERRKKSCDASNTKSDMLEGLMQVKDEEGRNLSDIEVLDNIVSLVVAGYESTSVAITWAFYYLAKYPEVLKKLREEHISVSKNKHGDFITSDDLLKLKYTTKVVEETIRLANIAAFFFRTAVKDVEYKGYKIPKGWKVLCWIRYLHTDPENFEDPLCFNPDRWDVPAKPASYLVFGRGARTCAGNMLARMQVAIFIHHLAVGYRWELVNPNADMTYLPHPIPVDGVEIAISKI